MTRRLADFAGLWRIERAIDDRRAGRHGTLTGTARFAPDNDGLRYAEEGTLSFPGQPALTASQVYLWRESDFGIEVRFSDGRPFHTIASGPTHPQARHDCAPDVYHVRYDFSRWPEWTARWDVQGPRKDYRVTTRYVRADDRG